MAPPSYADLGKASRDVFSKNYHFGLVKLDCKSKSTSGVEFNVSGTSVNDTGKVTGFMDAKYKLAQGITLKEKWTTDNNLVTELTAEDTISKGSKLSAVGNFAPQTGKKNVNVAASYKTDSFNASTDIDYSGGAPQMNASLVLGLQGWLVGSQLSFDSSKSKLTKTNFAFGYVNKDIVLHSNVNDGQVFGASVHQKVRPNVQAAVSINWNSANNATQFGVGGVYTIDKETALRAKINNQGSLGLGLTHKLREEIELTLCANIDAKNFNQGGHKLGLGITLQG